MIRLCIAANALDIVSDELMLLARGLERLWAYRIKDDADMEGVMQQFYERSDDVESDYKWITKYIHDIQNPHVKYRDSYEDITELYDQYLRLYFLYTKMINGAKTLSNYVTYKDAFTKIADDIEITSKRLKLRLPSYDFAYNGSPYLQTLGDLKEARRGGDQLMILPRANNCKILGCD
jgi:hypothetical protein